jgi:hypothetical protein
VLVLERPASIDEVDGATWKLFGEVISGSGGAGGGNPQIYNCTRLTPTQVASTNPPTKTPCVRHEQPRGRRKGRSADALIALAPHGRRAQALGR